MKNLKVRLGAAAMSVTLLAGCICSCAKGNQKKKEILATDPWYTMDKLVLGTEYDPADYVYLDFQLLGMSGGNFVTYTQGIKPFDKTFDPETDSYADFEIAHVNIYDETGAVVSSLDLMQLAEDNGYSVNDLGFNGTSLVNDEVVCKFTKYTDNKFSEVTAVIDPATGEVKSIDETEPENEEDGTSSYVEGTEKVDGYTIMKKMIYLDESYSYALETTSPDGTVQTYDFSKENPEMSIISIPTIISMGDGKVLLYCQSDKKKNSKYMVYDMDANTCEEYKEDTDWLKDVTSMYTTQNVEGLGCFFMKQDGIKKIDFSAKSVEDYMDFDSCNINRYDVMNFSILSMTEDKIVLGGTVWHNSTVTGLSGSETEVVILKKAETNPNAGKTILTIAALDYFSYPLCEAVGNFNESNDKYFIEYDNRYAMVDSVDLEAMLDANESNQAINDVNAKLSDQLAVDLVSGEGPDIIMNGCAFSQLNNSDYLLDLAPYVEKLDTSGLYSNVIDAAKESDGKLYQIPVTFAIEGLIVKADEVAADQTGFTYDEYAEFVSGPCNGTDPMGMNQVDFFNASASYMNDMFYENGKVNYDNEAFKALADYVKDNVPEKVEGSAVMYTGVGNGEETVAQYATMYSLGYYLLYAGVIKGDTKIVGCPTYDGRGPMFSGCDSAAIYSQTASPEGCWEFVSYLLSDEVQTLYGNNGSNPLNKEALNTLNQKEIDGMNAMVDLYLSMGYTEEELRAFGIPCDKIDESAAQVYNETIENCYGLNRSDPAVNSILKEEMPAYFSGQKSLEDVIPILEDRVQTFLNERG